METPNCLDKSKRLGGNNIVLSVNASHRGFVGLLFSNGRLDRPERADRKLSCSSCKLDLHSVHKPFVSSFTPRRHHSSALKLDVFNKTHGLCSTTSGAAQTGIDGN